MSPRLFFHSLCIRSSLHSTPVVPTPHRPFPGPLAIAACSIHGGARNEELLHHSGVAPFRRVVQRCPTSGAEGLGDVNGWLHPVALHRPPPHSTGRGSNLWSEVREFHLFKIVWQAGSMAATIVAGVCEDHQDYELMAPSRRGYPKRGKLFYA